MTIRSPRPEEIPDVLAMLTRAYRADRADFPDDPGVLRAYSDHDPEDAPDRWVVAFLDDAPVSALRIFLRDYTDPDGSIFPAGGIGNVGTAPEHGGRGLASQVMKAAHARMLEAGIETAILVTDIPDFYARFDYAIIDQGEIVGDRSAAAGIAVSVDRLPDEVPEWVRDLHESVARTRCGRVVRSPAYWERWIQEFKVRGHDLDAVMHAGAYAIGSSEENGEAYRVFEGGGRPDELARLVAHLAGGAGRIKTPDEPAMRDVMARLGATITPRARSGLMAVPLRPGARGAAAFTDFLELDAF